MSDVSGSHDTLKRRPSRIGNQKPIRDVHGVKAVEAKPGAAACHLIMAFITHRCRTYPPFEDNFFLETVGFPCLCKRLGYMCQGQN